MYYPLIRSLLFRFDAETSHHVALRSMAIAQSMGLLGLLHKTPQHPVNVMGIDFPNPVGLAAGLDKNGDYIDALAALGFGFIEMPVNGEAEKAIAGLHGTEIGGRTITVNQAKPKTDAPRGRRAAGR